MTAFNGGRASASMLLAGLSLVLAWALARESPTLPASTGSEAPPRRPLRAMAWDFYNKTNDHRLLAVAGGVAFFGLLALFPGIATFVALYGLFADWSTINGHLSSLTFMLPSSSTQIIADEVKNVTAQGNEALGLKFFLGFFIALWSANSGIKALFDALNVAYGVREERSFLKLNVESLLFTFAAILSSLAAFLAVVALPIAFRYFGLANIQQNFLTEARWPLLALALLLGLSVLYRFGPSRKRAKWRCVTWGGLLATLLWIGISILFSWYVTSIGSYNRTYGALGAIVGFMTWIWLSAIVILLGAELNAQIERSQQ